MQDSPSMRVTLGLALPHDVTAVAIPLEEVVSRCRALDIEIIELDASVLESFLGAPPEPALLRMPQDEFEHGLLPIEEEVFMEEMELGRATFAAQMRSWRLAADLHRLDEIRRQFAAAGIRIHVVRWDGLAALTDQEVDYAFTMAERVGARVLSADLSAQGIVRLGAAALNRPMSISFHGEEGTGAEALDRAIGASPSNGVSIDIGGWVAGGNGSPLPFLATRRERVTHVHLHPSESNQPIAAELFQAMRENRWSFPVMVSPGVEYFHDADATRAYLNGLRLIT